MPESFDDFARRHRQKKSDRERLANETKAEWQRLKDLTERMATEGKSLGPHTFAWERNLAGREMLSLTNVAATFLDNSERLGVPQEPCIRFSKRPPGSGQVSIGNSPLSTITWSLEPEIHDDKFVWCVVEQSQPYTPEALAEAIAVQLGKYLIDYEAAFGRQV